MALIIADRVKETTITEGTGTITLSGATFGGFQSFSDAIGEGNTTYYCIQNEANFEIGIGTCSSNTLSRDTIFQSSNSDNKISISGTAIVFCVVPADRLVFKDESDAVVFPTPFAFKRSDDGDYWQALSTDYTNRVASFFLEEGTDPVWKLGLKTTTSEIVAPYYALVTGKEGFVELRGSSSSILSIGDGNSEGLQISHQLKNIIDIRKNGGEIAIQNLDLSSDETTSAKNTSVAHTVFAIESSVSHAADLQTWSVATDEKASINQHGDFETSGNVISPSGRFNAVRFSDGSVQTSAGLPFSSGDYYLQEIRANSASGVVTSGVAAQNKTDIAIVSGLLYNDSSLSGYFESRVDSSDSSISSNSSSITANSGYFESRVDQADSSVTTVSGLIPLNTFNIIAGDGSNYTIDGMGLNSASDPTIYMHKGHTYILKKTFSGHPFRVSATDGGSVYSDADSNNIEIGSAAGSVTFEVPQNAPDKLYYYCTSHASNMKGLIYTTTDGATSGYFESRVDSSDSSISTNSSSITANSGYFESRVDTNAADIVTVSGLTSNASISGYFESRVDSADSSIAANSGYFESRVDTNASDIVVVSGLTGGASTSGYFESRVDTNAADIVTVSGLTGGGGSYNDAPISGYFESRVDSADSNIAANSGYFESRVDTNAADIVVVSGLTGGVSTSGYFESRVDSADSSITANSGYFESRVDTNAADIVTVSGLTGGGGSVTGGPSGVGFFGDDGVLTSGHHFTYNSTTRGITLNNSSTTDVGGITMTTNGGDHSISVVGNTQQIKSYYKTKILVGTTEVFNSRSSAGGEIGTSVPHFNRGFTAYQLAAAYKGVVIKAASSPTANLMEWQSYAGAVIASVSGDGSIYTSGTLSPSNGLFLDNIVPAVTTNKLYNDAGTLKFNGSVIGGGGGGSVTGGPSGVGFFGDDGVLTSGHHFTYNKTTRGITLNGSTSSTVTDCAGITMTTNGGDHTLDVDNNVQEIRSYNKTKIYVQTSAIFNSNGGSDIGNHVPNFPRGVTVFPFNAAYQAVVIKGLASQSANLTEWQNSSDVVLANITADGSIASSGTISASGGLVLNNLVPNSTTNALYNDGGTLKFNGSAVGGGSSYTAGSGLTLVGTEFNVHGGSGHFINLDVEGAFTATTKSFLIDHPSKEGMKLQYASLEGPENGVYIRGTSGSNIITLPDYWADLVDESTVTVSLTPIGSYQALYIEEKGKNYIKVGGSKGSYDYVVYGERKDVEKLKVEW